jgi:ATP-dependent DNA helicase RecQ
MSNSIKEILKNIFGYNNFRPLQEEIINRTLTNQDSLVLMPTGGGKSICYQIPAIYRTGLTVVISPLLSLMKDQVQALKSNGVSAAYFNSSLSSREEQSVLEEAKDGKYDLLYMSPEKLLQIADTWLKEFPLNLIAIDEAHCISIWGHDFRPEYTKLKILRKQFSAIPFMALTATADPATREDIIDQLGLKNPKTFISSFNRKNISLDVRGQLPKKSKLREIVNFLREKPNESGIIYCLSRKSTEEVADFLEKQGFKVGCYHAGLPNSVREVVQDNFIHDNLQIIVATIAFGMGIDKSNIRWVIHYNLPKNLEGYYQEIGRAGRDGMEAETRLYYSLQDIILYNQFADNSAQSDLLKQKLQRMLQYSEAKTCRRRILLSYFGEIKEENCNNCDICLNPPTSFDGTIIAQKALSAIARVKENEGSNRIIQILKGSQNAEIFDKNYHQLKTYGVGKDISFNHWKEYIIQLLNLGLIQIDFRDNSHLKISDLGWRILKEKVNVELTEPIDREKKKSKGKKSRVDSSSLDVKSSESKSELWELLRLKRSEIANQESVPAYIIFSDQTLKHMVYDKPTTVNEFLDLPGVGNLKLGKYGEQFMQIIRQYKLKNEPKKVHTTLKTYFYLKEGKTPEEIADIRKLSLTTVFSHLVQLYLEDRDVDLYQFCTVTDILLVKKAYKHFEGNIEGLKQIFDYLKEEIPYTTIRIVLAIIEKETSSNMND